MHLDTVWVYSSFFLPCAPIFMLILWPDAHKISRENNNTPMSNAWENGHTHAKHTAPVQAAVVVRVSEGLIQKVSMRNKRLKD